MKIQAKKLVGGKGQGPAIVSPEPISFLGGVGLTTGEVMDQKSSIKGRNISGHVLSFPGGKGSTVGSYVLYGLSRRGRAPAAMIIDKPDTIVTVGAVIGGIPAVYGIPPDILLDNEWVEVDGDKATIRVRDVDAHDVVTCFLRNKGRILLMRRSVKVGSYQGTWAGISGYVEGKEVFLERALTEIEEEAGVEEPKLISTGEPVYARDKNTLFIVHPFIFDAPTRDVKLDWEHVEYRWVQPSQIPKYPSVPKLHDAFISAMKAVPAER